MKLALSAFIKPFLLVVSSTFLIHVLILRIVELGISIPQLAEYYLILSLLSLAHFVGLKWLFRKWPRYAGLLFTGLSLFKMLLVILYLLPDLMQPGTETLSAVLNFMVVYFILLFFEVLFVVRKLLTPLQPKNPAEKNK